MFNYAPKLRIAFHCGVISIICIFLATCKTFDFVCTVLVSALLVSAQFYFGRVWKLPYPNIQILDKTQYLCADLARTDNTDTVVKEELLTSCTEATLALGRTFVLGELAYHKFDDLITQLEHRIQGIERELRLEETGSARSEELEGFREEYLSALHRISEALNNVKTPIALDTELLNQVDTVIEASTQLKHTKEG